MLGRFLTTVQQVLGNQIPPQSSSTPAPASASTKPSSTRPNNAGVGLVVDSETTGLDPNTDELIELGLVQFWFDKNSFDIADISENYSGLRQPGRPIPAEATKIHGLTDRDVRGTNLDGQRVRSLILGSDLLISHNAAFDKPFVQRLFPEVGEKTWLCSLKGIDWRALGHRSAGLQALATDYGLDAGSSHRALDDALLLLRVLRNPGGGGVSLLRVLVKGPASSGELPVVAHMKARSATRKWLAENLAGLKSTSDLLDRHFLYLGLVSAAYQLRKEDREHRVLCEELARSHLQEFGQIAPRLKQRFNGSLPYVPTFEQLSILLVEDGRFDDAVAVCEAAIRFGLDDSSQAGFEGRIERIQRKQGKPVVSNQEPPLCPYCKTRLKAAPHRKTKCPSCKNPIYFWPKQSYFLSPYLREDQERALYWLIDLQRFGVGIPEFNAKQEELRERFGSEARTQDILWGLFQESIRLNTSEPADLSYLYDRMAEFTLKEGANPFELLSHARRFELENLRSRGFQTVVIAARTDCCSGCAQLAGRRLTVTAALERVLLPLKECLTVISGQPHCRCRYDVPEEPIGTFVIKI
jgi:DNA polymerase-3 subunit epsilon